MDETTQTTLMTDLARQRAEQAQLNGAEHASLLNDIVVGSGYHLRNTGTPICPTSKQLAKETIAAAEALLRYYETNHDSDHEDDCDCLAHRQDEAGLVKGIKDGLQPLTASAEKACGPDCRECHPGATDLPFSVNRVLTTAHRSATLLTVLHGEGHGWAGADPEAAQAFLDEASAENDTLSPRVREAISRETLVQHWL